MFWGRYTLFTNWFILLRPAEHMTHFSSDMQFSVAHEIVDLFIYFLIMTLFFHGMHVFHDVQSLSWTFQTDPCDGLILCELKNFVKIDVLLWNYGYQTEVHDPIACFLCVCNLITLLLDYLSTKHMQNNNERLQISRWLLSNVNNQCVLYTLIFGCFSGFSYTQLPFGGKYCNFTCYFADYILLQSKRIFLYELILSAMEWKTKNM